MEGGINAWNGLIATGEPEAGIPYFADTDKPKDILALAWLLEEGARIYYKGIEELMEDEKSKQIFKELGAAEIRHKLMLSRLNQELAGPEEFPGPATLEELPQIMEGGMHISEALDWAKGKALKDILDYSIAMETNSYDLYIKMERKVTGIEAKKIFSSLLNEEKNHLARLTSLLDEKLLSWD